MTSKITLQDFLQLFEFNLIKTDLNKIENLVNSFNFNYELLKDHDRDKIIIEVLDRIASNHSKSGEKRKPEWNDGWAENLAEFVSTNYETNSLIPKYYRPSNIKRWKGNYIKTESVSFEYDFFQVIRSIIFYSLFENVEEVFEFGCGSPHNLVALSQINPRLKLNGCDWSQSAVTIVDLLKEKKGINAEGHLFDFFNPKLSSNVSKNSVFLTIGGLEQVGPDSLQFIDLIFEKMPTRIIHLEPISELYEVSETNLFDYLGRKYHQSRNYLSGYLTSIQELEKQGRAVIENVRRIPFGGQFHEGWSLIIWKPVNLEK